MWALILINKSPLIEAFTNGAPSDFLEEEGQGATYEHMGHQQK